VFLTAVLTAVLLVAPLTARAARPTTADSFDVSQLIDALSDPDWTVRKQASERLTLLGPAARPQIVRAARSDDPEQRARAAEILRKLPWYTADDPPSVRSILEHYGPSSDGGRVELIVQLVRRGAPSSVLLRLLNEEPRDLVRWTLVAALFQSSDAQTLKTLRELDPQSSDPPVLMLAGRAWLDLDRTKALKLLRRAVDADGVRPSNDQGMLGYAYEELMKSALARGDFDEAADLLRRQVPRDKLPTEMRERDALETQGAHLAALAALHRYFGPLRGYADDRRTWARKEAMPPSMSERVIGLLTELGSPPPLPATAKFDVSALDRHAAGEYLLRNKFLTAAELELADALPAAKQEGPYVEFDVMYLLGRAIAEAGRDDEAADWLDRAMRLRKDGRVELNDHAADDDIRAEIAFRRARGAQARGDLSAADRQVQSLLQCTPGNNDVTISFIRWLKETGRQTQARTLFERVYEQAHDRVSGADAKPGPQNDLAWLCARCGERLDDAIANARAAVEAMPDTAAFIDTLAEANFARGHREEAIKLETRALELSPENDFMRQQLERFKSAKP